jgi:hypothetical protein
VAPGRRSQLLLDEFIALLAGLREAFSQDRLFVRVCRQAFGALCALGVRTVARVLAATGRDQCDWSTEYRIFSRSPWKSREVFRPILKAALQECPAQGPIVLAGDFTHLPKSGKHTPGVTCMRDPMSPPFHTNLIYGLRFFQVTVLCSFLERKPEPLAARSIPVRFEASPVVSKPGKRATPEDVAKYKQAVKQKLSSNAARQTLVDLREDFDAAGAKGRDLLVTLDGSFCSRVFFGKSLEGIKLLVRCRKDAVLCKRAEEGSKCFYDKKTFTPEGVRQDEAIEWSKKQFFIGGNFHPIRFKEINGLLWRRGGQRRPLRLIVIAPTGYRLHAKGSLLYRQPAYLLTDDLETPVEKLIAAYLDHWQIEINHREEKDTMGVGNAQVRNKNSVPRQPAFVVAIYSILLLAALRAYGPERTEDYLPPPKWGRPSKRPSCLEIIALLRHQVVAHPEKLVDFEIETSALTLVLKAAA